MDAPAVYYVIPWWAIALVILGVLLVIGWTRSRRLHRADSHSFSDEEIVAAMRAEYKYPERHRSLCAGFAARFEQPTHPITGDEIVAIIEPYMQSDPRPDDLKNILNDTFARIRHNRRKMIDALPLDANPPHTDDEWIQSTLIMFNTPRPAIRTTGTADKHHSRAPRLIPPSL